MLEFLEVYIGCLFAGILFLYSGKRLFKEKERYNSVKLIISIFLVALLTTMFNISGINIVTNVLKIMLVFIVLCVYYFYIFKVNISKAVTGAFITYSITVVSDVVFGILIAILSEMFSFNAMSIYTSTILVNFIIYGSSLIIIKINAKKLLDLIENSDFSKKISIIVITIVMFTIAILVFRIPLDQWKLTADFIITMIITICFCIIGIYIIKQKSEIRKTSLKYQKLVDYSDITNRLLEDYRIVSHEHKNQLSIIRGMLNNTNNELVDYIDNLLEKRNVIKYQWIGELNNLPLSGLKGLINYKIMEMEKEKLNINIIISKEISKTKLSKLTSTQKDNLYSIIGIFLDNAIQAAKESEDKEISLEIYLDKKDIVLILANTYKGKINLDKIDDYGFSTKGKNHGIGLHIVKKILEDSKIFTQKTSIIEKYFIQELHISLKNIK